MNCGSADEAEIIQLFVTFCIISSSKINSHTNVQEKQMSSGVNQKVRIGAGFIALAMGAIGVVTSNIPTQVANAATRYVKQSTDNSAEVTAYFDGINVVGFHLKDIKCDGYGVQATIHFTSGGVNVRQNYRGCGKDLWVSDNFASVRNMQVCRLNKIQFPVNCAWVK
jgi:hypothetical protein